MRVMQKEEYLELGLIYAREGNLKAALKSIHRALALYAAVDDPQGRVDDQALEGLPLELLSYYGLCLALVENRVEDGVRLCRRALSKEALRPDFYLNLGRVYMKGGQKAKALNIFRRGLELTEKNTELLRELKKHGVRKKQIFAVLPRNHFVNKYGGLFLHWLRIPRKWE